MNKFFRFVTIGVAFILLWPWLLWHRWPFILHRQGKYNQALRGYLRRLESPAIKKQQKHQCLIYFNIGLIYKKLGDSSFAEKYFILAKQNGCEFDQNNFNGNTPLTPEKQ